MQYKQLQDLILKNKRVLIREDFNVPMKDGVIQDDARIRAGIPSIHYALSQGAGVIVLSHLGRPKEIIDSPGEHFNDTLAQSEFSLAAIAKRLSELLRKPVRFVTNFLHGIDISPGEIVLCENTRFFVGEKKCDDALSQKMAALCDVFVMDAFAVSHRAEASTVGVAKFAKEKCAGLLLDAELNALSTALTHPEKPVVAIVGGSKISTKMVVLEALLDKVNVLIVGGGIANTFLAAQGYAIGASLIEMDWIDAAKKILLKAAEKGVKMPLPIDVAVAKKFSADERATLKSVRELSSNDMILDIGPKTAAFYAEFIQKAKTIIWNGPVGVFEFSAFAAGTRAIGEAVAHSGAFSIAGGGDTLSAIAQFKLQDNISYLSTGGGAFLEWVEGKILPGVAALSNNHSDLV